MSLSIQETTLKEMFVLSDTSFSGSVFIYALNNLHNFFTPLFAKHANNSLVMNINERSLNVTVYWVGARSFGCAQDRLRTQRAQRKLKARESISRGSIESR